jgi:hypothetical protein
MGLLPWIQEHASPSVRIICQDLCLGKQWMTSGENVGLFVHIICIVFSNDCKP